jgi:hypothetical protein
VPVSRAIDPWSPSAGGDHGRVYLRASDAQGLKSQNRLDRSAAPVPIARGAASLPRPAFADGDG